MLIFTGFSRDPGIIGVGEVDALAQRRVVQAPHLDEKRQARNIKVFLL